MADQIVIEYKSDTSGLISSIEALKNLKLVNEEQYQAFVKANEANQKAMADLAEKQNQASAKTEQATKSMEDLNNAAKNLGETIKNGATATLSKDLGNAAQKSTELSGSIRDLEAELKNAKVQFGANSAEAQKLENEILKSAIAHRKHTLEMRELTKAGSDGGRMMAFMTNSVMGAMNAYGALSMVIAGEGEENEKAQKAMMKSMAIMQMMMAVTELLTAKRELADTKKLLFDKLNLTNAAVEEATGLKWLNLQTAKIRARMMGTAATEAETVANVENTVGTEINAAAQVEATAATSGMTIGQWLLNAALYACPIVWIVAGIAALVAIVYLAAKGFMWLKDHVAFLNTFFEANIRLAHAIRDAFRDLGSFLTGGWIDSTKIHEAKVKLEEYAKAQEALSETLKGRVELLEGVHASETRIAAERQKQIQAEINALQAKIKVETSEKDLKELNEKLDKAKIEMAKNDIALIKARAEEMGTEGKTEKEAAQFRQGEYLKQMTRLENLSKATGTYSKAQLQFFKDEAEGYKNLASEEGHTIEKQAKEEEEKRKEKYEKAKQDREKKRADALASAEELRKLQIANIQDAMEREKQAAIEDAKEKTEKLAHDVNYAAKKEEIEKALANKLLDIDKKAAEDQLAKQKEADDKLLAQINADKDQELKNALASKDLNILFMQKEGAYKYDIEQAQYERELLAAQDDAVQKEKVEQEHIKRMKDMRKQDAQDALDKFKGQIQQIQQYASQVGQILTQQVKNEEQVKLNQYDAEMAKIEDLHNRKVITDKDYAAKKKVIDDKIAAEKKKAAEEEKKIKMGEAIINTAAAIAKTIAEVPKADFGVMTGILVALYAAMGAEQIAAIQNTPAFAKGTKNAPAGFKWVGEEGPELIYDEGGYPIITHPESMKIMQNYDIPVLQDTLFTRWDSTPTLNREAIDRAMQIMYSNNTRLEIDYDKLARKMGEYVGKEVKSIPEHKTVFDKDGFTDFVKRSDSKVTYKTGRERK